LDATEDHVPVYPDNDTAATQPLHERRAELDFYLRNPDNRPSIESIINELKDDVFYRDQIVPGGHRIFDARDASFGMQRSAGIHGRNRLTSESGELDDPLSQQICDVLCEIKNIKQLYSHQAEAINNLSRGHNVIVSTSTSSGKSLIYQIPALCSFERDITSTALYIFPTKALAQDQKRALAELLSCCEGLSQVSISTFDGDTPWEDREFIRENSNVIFTNPDMLHLTILPNEESWRRFFRKLHIVVLDGAVAWSLSEHVKKHV
jgi:DEAD/DEAH box helicase domain-containing protein